MDDWNEKLFWAVKLGKVTHVKNLIAEGASVHYKKSYFNGVSLLRVAKDKAIIEILIEKGINVNSLDVNGSTHLHNAINDGNDELTHVLIKHKANVNAENKQGQTPLHIVNTAEIAKILIQNGSNMNSLDFSGWTPLHSASRNGKAEVINALIRNKANVNAENQEKTPLDLLEDYFSQCWPGQISKGDSSLHLVSMKGNMAQVTALVSLGANVSAKTTKGETPLHQAIRNNNGSMVNCLIHLGADVSASNTEGDTPLHVCARYGYLDICESLIVLGANISATNNKGETPLYQAILKNKDAMVERLINLGANVSASDSEGDTALHKSASYGNIDMVERLIGLGADVSATNKKGDTPIHQSARNGQLNTVGLLKLLGANVLATNNEGKTPKDVAGEAMMAKTKLSTVDRYHSLLKYLQKEMDSMDNTKKQLHQLHVTDTKKRNGSKKSNSNNSSQACVSKEKDCQLPWLVDADDFQRMLSHGEYRSYENRLSLGGPCRAGKSTLASVLIGEKIPQKWISTDGLVIFFGRNGIDIENEKMVPLKKGERGHGVIAKILRGAPDVRKTSGTVTQGQTSSLSKQIHASSTDTTDGASQAKTLQRCKDTTNISKHELGHDKLLSVAKPDQKNLRTDILNERTSSAPTEIQTLEFQKLQLQTDILEEVRNRQYKIQIAPSDLIDFGGQKSYDMTHQLFIQHTGSFLLMFDGRYGLHEEKDGVTAKDVLKHWVDSVLAYIEDTADIMPMIMFAATHRDQCENNVAELKKHFIKDINEIFYKHEKKNHIYLETVYFINGLDKNDAEIRRLTNQVVQFAMKQLSWGQRRPMQWVPLELQIANMRMKHVHIITKEDLQSVNKLNNDLALNEGQLNDFLLVQHSLGKLMYYNLSGLDKFIVIHPPTMVNILRSFVTDEKFFPVDHRLKSILIEMKESGQICKTNLLKLWQQSHVHTYMPDDVTKEFVIKLLIHLDILIIPKAFTHTNDVYLVPCMIKAIRPSDFNSIDRQGEHTIYLRYSLSRHSIPTGLAYKIIGASLNVWPLKNDSKPCLYQKAAIFNVSEDNELRIWLEDNRVMVCMTHKHSLHLSPDVAASVQECLTKNLESCLLFHYNSFGKRTKSIFLSELYTLEVGIQCGNNICYISSPKVMKKDSFRCNRGIKHDTRYLKYWFFDRSQEKCRSGCQGLSMDELKTEPSDKHLVRLVSQMGIASFKDFFIHLGMEGREWENTIDMYEGHSAYGKMALALHKWKLSGSKSNFKDLAEALTKVNLDKHIICQVLREKSKPVDIADSNHQDTPSDQDLKELSKQIGNCPLQLGIELGLSFSEVEQSLFSFPRDLSGLVEAILMRWKKKSKIKTIQSLMTALERVNAGGLKYKFTCTKNKK